MYPLAKTAVHFIHTCVCLVYPPPPLTPEILGSTTIKTLLFVSENRAYMLKQLVIHNCKVLVSVCKILMNCKTHAPLSLSRIRD